MTPYPAALPTDAIAVIVNDIKNNATVADRVNFAKAVWELEGYALKVGLGDPTPVNSLQSEPPLSDADVVAHLESALAASDEPATPEFAFAAFPAVLALLPWKAILKWALTAVLASL